jgi:transcription elongation factor Elf1
VCDANFQTSIHYLTEPVDVFCEWIDSCEEENDLGEQKGEQQEEEPDFR